MPTGSTTAGSSPTGSAQTTTSSGDSYTDTGLADGEQYHYTLRRVTNDTSSDSTQTSATTLLPETDTPTIQSYTQDTITIDVPSFNDDNADGYRVMISTDGGSSFSQDGSDLQQGDFPYTTTTLTPGTKVIKIRAFTEHVTSDSNTVTQEFSGLPVEETKAPL